MTCKGSSGGEKLEHLGMRKGEDSKIIPKRFKIFLTTEKIPMSPQFALNDIFIQIATHTKQIKCAESLGFHFECA